MVTPASPLPWRQHQDDEQRIHLDGDPIFTVARTFVGAGVRTRAEADANARYIVTACNAYPELLAALKELAEQMPLPVRAIRAIAKAEAQ